MFFGEMIISILYSDAHSLNMGNWGHLQRAQTVSVAALLRSDQ
jgi:hypothetical protein